MELPMFSKALRTEVIDGKVYVDLEQLTQLIFDISNETTLVATETGDAALGVMSLGVTHIGSALDGALALHQKAAGLTDQPKPCSLTAPHTAHAWLKGRKSVRCDGVARQD